MDATKPTGAGRPAHGEAFCDAPPLSAEQVYHDYAPRVYNMARRMVSNDADAEDVTQDVLLQVVRKLPSFRGESAFPTWLHRVTVNTALSHRRRQAVRHEYGVRLELEAFQEDQVASGPRPGWIPAPDVQLSRRETRVLIERAVAGLPTAYRTVFVLSEVEGLPNQDIADQLGLSLPAVKSRLHRARHMLRDALAPHFGEVLA